MLWSYKKCQETGAGKGLGRVRIQNLLAQTYSPRQNIWNKMEKSSKTGQEKKSLLSGFACFLTAICEV